jgi:hypothetical protein
MSRGGWNSSTPVGETYKPYDPIRDPYCPHTKTNKFVKHLDGFLKKEKSERKAQLRKQAKIGVTVPPAPSRRHKVGCFRSAAWIVVAFVPACPELAAQLRRSLNVLAASPSASTHPPTQRLLYLVSRALMTAGDGAAWYRG